MPDDRQFKIDPDYNEVADRIAEFRTKHPGGSLRPLDPAKPFDIVTLGDRFFVVYVAVALRAPDDPTPGIGMAWEPFPGKTPYTRDSELQNAETAAWGRAIIASLASTSKKVASATEVRNRQADQEADEQPAKQQPSRPAPRKRAPPQVTTGPVALERVAAIKARLQKLDEKRLTWARSMAKQEEIPKYDSTEATAEDLGKLEKILELAEVDQDGRPFTEDEAF